MVFEAEIMKFVQFESSAQYSIISFNLSNRLIFFHHRETNYKCYQLFFCSCGLCVRWQYVHVFRLFLFLESNWDG